MMSKIIATLILVVGALLLVGCSSSDSTADAPPKGPEPEVKTPPPGMLPPEQRGAKPSEGPDGGM